MKTCDKCGKAKERSEFYKRKDSADGLRASCKLCWAVLCREPIRRYRAANPDANKLYLRKHRARYLAHMHRRRARTACAVPQRWRPSASDPAVCYWCGCTDADEWHVEHVMPISLGGPADDTNEVLACAGCNLSKGGKHPLVWLAEQF